MREKAEKAKEKVESQLDQLGQELNSIKASAGKRERWYWIAIVAIIIVLIAVTASLVRRKQA